MFEKEEQRQKKKIIEEMNAELNKKLEKVFARIYPDKKKELISNGNTEEQAERILSDLKSDIQRDMMVEMQKRFRDRVSTIMENSERPDTAHSSPPTQPYKK